MSQVQRASRNIPLSCVAFYLLLVFYLIHSVFKAAEGHFVYALDDPYIHLALAENLAHGHYGINPGEFTSPDSSLIWPFLLVPFAGTAIHLYVPLAWNILFGSLAAWLIGRIVATWPPLAGVGGRMPWSQQAFTGILLIFAANLPSLTITGMEHVLQILLAICCAFGMMEALSGRPVPWWSIAAAVLAPAVRYEDLTLTLAICFALAGLRKWTAAAGVFIASLVPLFAFSLFLHSKGLPALPLSVLVKGSAFTSGSLPVKILTLLKGSIHQGLTTPERYPILVLFLIFAYLAYRADTRIRRYVYTGTAALGLLQLLIGRFGWFFRYELYALVFLTLLCMRILHDRPRFFFGYFALGLMFCASPYIGATAATASAARAVYEQQYQMHRFVTGFYKGDYAVNDLGFVSFERRPGSYVLDVYGLGSLEASRQMDKTADWMEAIVSRRHVALAMLFPDWFSIPASWSPLAKMCIQDVDTTSLGGSCVVFYSTAKAGNAALRAELKAFSTQLPDGIAFYLGGPLNEDSMWQPVTEIRQKRP